MTARFAGKSVVVTGGASGIGEAMVRLAAAEGARVAIADLDEARGNTLIEELGRSNTLFTTRLRRGAGARGRALNWSFGFASYLKVPTCKARYGR
jgi:NAD(P)-dependent dehydrogenase (short-subunit alcohol dehydrogenase family)